MVNKMVSIVSMMVNLPMTDAWEWLSHQKSTINEGKYTIIMDPMGT